MTKILLKRAYLPAEPTDGYRVFVDRLWPRGMSKENFHYNLWVKDIEPSAELREWFHQDRVGRWDEFAAKYRAELEASPAMQHFVDTIAQYPVVTLLFGSKDTEHNQAVVIAQVARELVHSA